MSISYCHNCNKYIDEDFDVEHFEVCGVEEEQTLCITKKGNPFIWLGDINKLPKGVEVITTIRPNSNRVYNKWYKELWWWLQEKVIILLDKIRLIK